MQAGTTGRNIESRNTDRPLIQFTAEAEREAGKTKASVASMDEIEDELSKIE